jgi:hypothetical protein
MAVHAERSRSLVARIVINFNGLETFGLGLSGVLLLCGIAFKNAADVSQGRAILLDDRLSNTEQSVAVSSIASISQISHTEILYGTNPLADEPWRSALAITVALCVILSIFGLASVVALEISQNLRNMKTVMKARQLEEEVAVQDAPHLVVGTDLDAGAAIRNPLYSPRTRETSNQQRR